MILNGRAVFLDRDGVLIDDPGHLVGVEQVRLLPGAGEAIRAFRALGYRVGVITNQSVVARGMLSVPGLAHIHALLAHRLASQGAPIDGIWWCPHHPEGVVDGLVRHCACRKPAPGLVLRAAAALRVVRDQRSVFVGDQLGDLACAVAAGVRPILVRTGKGRRVEAEARARHPGLAVVDDLRGVPPLLRG